MDVELILREYREHQSTDERLQLLVAVARRMALHWYDHTLVSRDADPRGAYMTLLRAGELLTLVDAYFCDVPAPASESIAQLQRLCGLVAAATLDESYVRLNAVLAEVAECTGRVTNGAADAFG